eukprot:CAMPEP_0194520300 /NCGR_PEP_ID=MMETSP0253-20130528/54225_1 /TAXON_ID=2966 /ORGANISM="Noctiluca scintillans" /LENGTH=108 /DNA_ID=CAMNT_0039364517 /DNA_START=50 /DNA_END=373 /DNA_ORIENTATION=-
MSSNCCGSSDSVSEVLFLREDNGVGILIMALLHLDVCTPCIGSSGSARTEVKGTGVGSVPGGAGSARSLEALRLPSATCPRALSKFPICDQSSNVRVCTGGNTVFGHL